MLPPGQAGGRRALPPWPIAAALTGIVLLSSALVAAGATRSTAADGCSARTVSPGYAQAVRRALVAGRDVLGERLLGTPNGPTYESAKRALPGVPFYAVGANGRPVTSSGAYYLALTTPPGTAGPSGYALHVADGGEIVDRRVTGPRLGIFVGAGGRERFGACRRRLGPSGLASGWLPILETAYVDAHGAGYRQESFVGRRHGRFLSFLHLVVDTRGRAGRAEVRLAASPGASQTVRVARDTVANVYASWSARSGAQLLAADAYRTARAAVIRGWRKEIDGAVPFLVPELRVVDAERALLVQEVAMGWRYSIGNTYEELSFAESLDAAEVMAEYGFGGVAGSIVDFALRRLPERYLSRRAGEVLATIARLSLLAPGTAISRDETTQVAGLVEKLGRTIDRPGGNGLVGPEAVSTDIGTKIYGLHGETAVWAGLSQIGRALARAGRTELAARCRVLAGRLGAALARAVHRSERWLPDGSLFVPLALLARARPFERVTATRDGSYWNLLMPYALASGFFAPHSREAQGILRYQRLHGSLLLGLVRGADEKLYGAGRFPASGVDEVYGLAESRFLADEDQPRELDLSLYGMLAGTMAPGTFVSGEGTSIAPVHGRRDRTMVLPPNNGANAAYLETLRLMLVHEVGAGRGLDLAFATPPGWLDDGGTIRVRNAPTAFGRVSYSIRRRGDRVTVALNVPRVPHLRLRLRLPSPLRLASVRIGGRSIPFDSGTGTIDLSGRHGGVEVDARLA